MSKKISIIFDESTGGFSVDMDGFEDDDCKKEFARLKALLEEDGIDIELVDIKKKPPKIPVKNRIAQKERGR